MKVLFQVGLVLLSSGFLVQISSQSVAHNQAILTRDIDRRPLPKISLANLSPRMRSYTRALLAQEKADSGAGATPETMIYRIPVAPAGHRLYLIDQKSEGVCGGNGALNCPQTVVDETTKELQTIVQGGSAGILVVRRPHLQMPDIAVVVQEGHFATNITAYRYLGKAWAVYLCKHIEPIDNDPAPAIVADAPCID